MPPDPLRADLLWSQCGRTLHGPLRSELRSRHIESRSETVRRRATRFTWVSRWLSIQAARSLHFSRLAARQPAGPRARR